MTTKEFVILEKRLLSAFPGFTIKGSLMFLTPVEYTLRGFSFEGSAFDKTSFYATAFFMALCIPRKHLIFNLGERLRERGSDRWTIKAANIEAALKSEMEKHTVFFKRLKTARDVAEAAMERGNPQDPYSQETTAYMLILAQEVDSALRAFDRLLAMLDAGIPWQHEMAVRAQSLKTELRNDPKKARSQLEIWRKETLRNLKLLDFSVETSQVD